MILYSADEIKIKPSNIVSLVPSQTELLFYLGLEKEVKGITKFCVHPTAWRKEKTIAGGTKNINIDIIKKLSPDLVIANKEENEKKQVEELAKDYNVWVTDVNNLEDALEMIKDIGQLTGTDEKANDLVIEIANAFKQLKPTVKKIRSCYLIWKEPYMTIGGDTFISDMMKKCGFDNIYADKSRYPIVEIEALRNSYCELLFLSSEPYPFKENHIIELQQQLPGTRIIVADGEMFSWYGSRLLKAVEYFSNLINSTQSSEV
jgi:ABC-type Fe3+-hydroxamate transport system substrate-binding protein